MGTLSKNIFNFQDVPENSENDIFRSKITKNELPQNLLQIMLISPSFTSDRNCKFIFSIFDFFKHEINFESLKCSKFKDIKFISKILFFLSVQFYLCKYQDFFKFPPFKNKKKKAQKKKKKKKKKKKSPPKKKKKKKKKKKYSALIP